MSALGHGLSQRWQAQWAGLSGRERAGLGLAASLLTLALVWSLAVAPAWRQWQQGQGQTAALQQQWQYMQALQAQASALKGQARLGSEEAARWLQTSVTTLGPTASVSVNGDMATAQFKGISGAALAQWLAQTRSQAQSLPVQARLSRSASATPLSALPAAVTSASAQATAPHPSSASAGPVLWDGQIVLQLPPKAKP